MPFGDLTVSEGKVVRWLKAVGDKVEGRRADRRNRDRQGGGRDRSSRRRRTLSRIDQPVGAVVPMGGRIGGIKQ